MPIDGVSAELETMLNKLNIIKFEQVAALTDDEIANLDDVLKLNGVIEKTDWISQSQRLVTEAAVEEVPAEEAPTDGGTKPE